MGMENRNSMEIEETLSTDKMVCSRRRAYVSIVG